MSNRLKVYESQTAPLVSFYEDRGKLKVVPATGEIDDVLAQLEETLSPFAATS